VATTGAAKAAKAIHYKAAAATTKSAPLTKNASTIK